MSGSVLQVTVTWRQTPHDDSCVAAQHQQQSCSNELNQLQRTPTNGLRVANAAQLRKEMRGGHDLTCDKPKKGRGHGKAALSSNFCYGDQM